MRAHGEIFQVRDIQICGQHCNNKRSKHPNSSIFPPPCRLEFRQLVRRYNVDLCYTPMLLAESFWRSEKCRRNDFTISAEDSPLICQFASNNTEDLLRSAELVAPYVDGVDINCGCPQEWAIKKGMGCGLLRAPHKMEDFVKTLKRNLPGSVRISTKIRVLETPERTVELARRMERCGVDFITIHGRTSTKPTLIFIIDYLSTPIYLFTKVCFCFHLQLNKSHRAQWTGISCAW